MSSSGPKALSARVLTSEGLPNGFSLVEILFALLVLATGLLGLESLAIVAVRSVALAERQSGYARVAGDSLESARLQLRGRQIPRQFCRSDLAGGDRLYRAVSVVDSSVVVTVGIVPNEEAVPKTLPLRLATSAFLPIRVEGEPGGEPCR